MPVAGYSSSLNVFPAVSVGVGPMGYAICNPGTGFVLATTLMALPVGRAFGGTLRASLVGGLGLGLGLFFLFDKLLDVILPTGVLAFVLGGR